MIRKCILLLILGLFCISCGKLWGTVTFFGGATNPFTSEITVLNLGSVTTGTGRPQQSHVIYATNSGTWWLFYISGGSTNILRTVYSTDLVNWNSGSTITLSNPLNDGGNFGVTYKNIGGHDVIHIPLSYEVSNTDRRHYHVRATISGTILTFGAESPQIDCAATDPTDPSATQDGPVTVIASDNKIYDFDGFWGDAGGCNNYDDVDASRALNADLGSSWVSGFNPGDAIQLGFTGTISSHFGAPLAGGTVLTIQPKPTSVGSSDFTNLEWAVWNGAAWVFNFDIWGVDFGSLVNSNDWTAVQLSNVDIRAVVRTGANTYVWQKYNGAVWAVPPQSIPNQTSLTGTGPFLATDGTNIWLFAIDSDAPNTVRYIKFDGANWGTWKVLEGSTATRGFLSGYGVVTNNTIVVLWTETVGGNTSVVLKALLAQ